MKNFSILGYGHIGRVHQQAIEDAENAQLVSVIDFNLPEDLSVKKYSTLESFLTEDRETEIVVIAPPNGSHRDYAIRCLRADKNILLENLIALSIQDVNEILNVAEERGCRVFTSMQICFSPVVQYVKKLIDNHCLGQVFMININCYWNRNKNYYKLKRLSENHEINGGILFTQFSNFIDVLNFWFKEINCAGSKTYNFNHQNITDFEDSGILNFTADGAVGNMVYTTSVFNKNFESNITIISEKGTIKIGDQYLNQMLYSDLKNVCCSQKISTDQKDFYSDLITEISNTLESNDSESFLEGKHALKLVKFIVEANDFARNNNKESLKIENYEISHA